MEAGQITDTALAQQQRILLEINGIEREARRSEAKRDAYFRLNNQGGRVMSADEALSHMR